MQQCHPGTDIRGIGCKQISALQDPKQARCTSDLSSGQDVPMILIIEQSLLGWYQKATSKGIFKLDKSIILVSITKLCKLYPLSQAQLHIICLMYIYYVEILEYWKEILALVVTLRNRWFSFARYKIFLQKFIFFLKWVPLA